MRGIVVAALVLAGFASDPAWARPRRGHDRAVERRTSTASIRAQIAAWTRAPHPEQALPARVRALAEIARLRGLEAARRAAPRLGVRLLGADVTLHVEASTSARESLARQGFSVQSLPGTGTLQVTVPLDRAVQLASTPGVRRIRAPIVFEPHALDEGTVFTGADVWQRFVPLPGLALGRPVKVAIIDGGFEGYASLLGTDLPVTLETRTFCGELPPDIEGCPEHSPHGTAVAEIVHDMAPDAELLLITVDLSGVAIQQAAEFARTWGADIVTTSLGTRIADRTGRGGLCGTARSLRESGILWVFSAGNEGSACTHEHFDWEPSSAVLGGDLGLGPEYGRYQRFPAGTDVRFDEFTLPAGVTHLLEVTWTPFNEPTDDFDLFYFCDSGSGYELVAASTEEQCGAEDGTAYEAVVVENDGVEDIPCAAMIVEKNVATCPHAPRVQFDVWSEALDTFVCWDLERPTSSFSIGHPADCEEVIATGAVCVHSGNLEVYSGRGPTLDDRRKPDICAPDATSTESYGPGRDCPGDPGASIFGFPGTSGAAPHTAGALALLYGKLGGSYSLEQVWQIVQRRAIDVFTTGPDDLCGAGVLCLLEGGCPR